MKRLIGQRPKRLLAVYVEPRQVAIVRARRKWRTWEVDSVEQLPVPEGEGLYDFLQRLNLRPRGRGGATLLLLLPRLYYGFHREHYPVALGDNLEEALAFDWPENIFHEPEQTLHFFGKAISVSHHISIPIFSLQNDIYEKFYNALGGASFQHFNIIPTAPNYSAFLNQTAAEADTSEVEIFGRPVDQSCLEVHKFYKGVLIDSNIVRKETEQFKLFRESLLGLDGSEGAEHIPIKIICQPGDASADHALQWRDTDLPIEILQLENPLLLFLIDHLLEKDTIETFNPPLLLKPWQVPKAAWAILLLVAAFSLHAFYRVESYDSLVVKSQLLKKQRTQLEAQWKPIEQLQNRVGKFEQDQQALTQFGDQGYPMLGLLTLLTEVTPQDTWLNYLSLRQGELMLRGESASAIKYLTELSKVKGFDDARFASPVTRNPSSDKERFNLQIKLNMGALKKTLEAIPLEGGALEIPQKGDDLKEPPPGTPPPEPDKEVPEALMGAPSDDNETTILMPPPGDDNETRDQNSE